jgi:hypothetical protein
MSLRRVIGVWALLAFAMSANGILREAVLVRVAGRRLADIMSVASGITIILAVTRRFLGGHSNPSSAARTGFAWVAMTVVFEFAVGRLVDKKSWSELFGNYAIWRGKLWPVVLGTVAVSPWLWRGSRDDHDRA